MKIGNCDLCGRWSSDLEQGACPACRAKYIHTDANGEEVPLGAEAGVSHVVQQQERGR